MKRIFILVISLVLTIGASAQNLFVGTYNLRYANNGDEKKGNGWQQRCPVVCGQILFEKPDIFGTQETLVSQVKDMQRRLQDYSYIGVGRDDGKEAGEYECIWYRKDRLKLLDEGHFWLSETPEKPGLGWDAACVRICTWGKFTELRNSEIPQPSTLNPQPFYFFNLHMDHVGVTARREAAKLVVSKIKEICKGAPVILTGDFNVDQNNEIYTIFTESGLLKDSYVAAKQRFAENGTFNSFNPSLKTSSRIDHIFVSPATDVENYAIMPNYYWTTADGTEQKGQDAPTEIDLKASKLRCASDHNPVWAKIRLSKSDAVVERGFLYDTPQPPTCHAVTLVEAPNGDILACFFGGTYEGHPDSSIWLCRLKKGSHTWTAPELLTDGVRNKYIIKAFDYDKPMKERKPCYNPVLYKAQNGDIVLDYKIGVNMQDWTGWEMRSSDNGFTWTNPRPLTTKAKERHLRLGPIKDKPLVNQGRIIAGSSTEVTYDSWKVHFETSDDDGKTWQKREVKCDTILCIQPTILNLGNGHLKALCRTRQHHIAVTESFDNGSTWTDMKFSDLPNNDSGIDAVTLNDGSHLLICNDSGTNGKRSPLTLLRSTDGEHWTKVMDIEEDDGKEYSYPAIIQTSDGDVWIMYTWHREKIAWAHVRVMGYGL